MLIKMVEGSFAGKLDVILGKWSYARPKVSLEEDRQAMMEIKERHYEGAAPSTHQEIKNIFKRHSLQRGTDTVHDGCREIWHDHLEKKHIDKK